ncbi:zinc finger MYM-type protein 1-like [Mixophyes fleayi]|uniref:zinc finger MYM-type protein 1-like n=1 Tax=Mixophyes fleayi TaxID=3061075 RepID=UPI003F4DF756
MPPKKPSGAQFRKRRQGREKEVRKLSHHFQHWLTSSASDGGAGSSRTVSSPLEISDSDPEYQEELPAVSGTADMDPNLEIETDRSTICVDNEMLTIKFKDPHSWPNITDKVRCCLVKHGPEQQKDSDFTLSTTSDGKQFSHDWFVRTLPNGQTVEREWLMYSEMRRAVFCFPCMLFGNISACTPSIANHQKGFSDWRHLNPEIGEHERSSDHFQNFLSWKSLERNLKQELPPVIASEKEKWVTVSRTFLDAIIFCAKSNLALRGSCDIIGQPNSGTFLNALELISHYNPQLAGHIKKYNQDSVSYFSPVIQNEFINILCNTVRQELINRIKEAKYYSIIFDSTSDPSHTGQLCEIIRYVRIGDRQYSVEESFIGFIETTEKTGSCLAAEIEDKLCKDGLDPGNIRGQGYDNGANMAGKYNDVQARLKQVNNLARIVPCAAHSLNLVGVRAASSSTDMALFFGTVQRLFNFFASSTSRWETLKSILKITLKGHRGTMWQSKAQPIGSLSNQLPGVIEELYKVSEQTSYPETVSLSESLVMQINFKFICLLLMWNRILNNIDCVNQELQKEGLSVDQTAKLIGGLQNGLEHMREEGVGAILKDAADHAQSMDLPLEFPMKRKRKMRRTDSEEVHDEGCSMTTEQLFRREFFHVLDSVIAQLKWRCETLMEISSEFQFLTGPALSNMPLNDMKKRATDLALKYSNDISASDIVSEIKSFKYQAPTLLPHCSTATPQDILNIITKLRLRPAYPYINIALRIFLCMPVTMASCERSFSKLKLVKNYLRSSIGQQRPSNLAILYIEHELISSMNFDTMIEEFASVKARKMPL